MFRLFLVGKQLTKHYFLRSILIFVSQIAAETECLNPDRIEVRDVVKTHAPLGTTKMNNKNQINFCQEQIIEFPAERLELERLFM